LGYDKPKKIIKFDIELIRKKQMKKILIASAVVVILLQCCYILKLKHDLDIRKLINEKTIMQVLDRNFFEYTRNTERQTVYQDDQPLDEPDCLNDQSDVVERIEMLEMHLDYNPSKKWIKDVLHYAKINFRS
jgi:hypothetical protein